MGDDSDQRLRIVELQVSHHLGQCEERHKEIMRRHDEGRGDREQLRVDLARTQASQSAALAQTNESVDKLNAKMWSIAIGVAGGAIAVVAQFIFLLMKGVIH